MVLLQYFDRSQVYTGDKTMNFNSKANVKTAVLSARKVKGNSRWHWDYSPGSSSINNLSCCGS